MAFEWNWQPQPIETRLKDARSIAAANAMQGYLPLEADPRSTEPTPAILASEQMAGYNPTGELVNTFYPRDVVRAPHRAPEQYDNFGQGAIYTQKQIDAVDQQIAANNARIAQLKQELSKIMSGMAKSADEFDRMLAANRANVGDLANAQTHLGRIEARKLAEEQRKSAERIRAIERMGKNGEFDDLMKIAKMRTNLEAVAKDPGLRSGLEREYNIAVQQYMNKYGHAPDFSNFENSVNLFYDRSGYMNASDEDLSKDKSVLDNFVTNNTDVNGRWKGGDAELKRAIAAAEKQGNAELAKKLKNMWTPEQFNKYLADMHKEGETALDGLGSFARAQAERDGKFTDKANRKWEKKNGKWKSTDYKWNGKRNGV